MTATTIKLLQVYRCPLCGNIFELIHVGGGTPSCCGQEMVQVNENTVEASLEKHVPVVEKTATGITVRVGSIPHPMEEKHYIEWIEVIVGGKACRQFLQPGDAPEASFPVTADDFVVRAYCNLHGLWKGE